MISADEKGIYDAVMSWVCENAKERRRYLATLFLKIRLPLMSIDDLLDVSKHELIDADVACNGFIKQVITYKLSKTKFDQIPEGERLVTSKHFEQRKTSVQTTTPTLSGECMD